MLSNTVKFWSYLIFLIPSIICSLFVLYYLLFDRTLRHALNNHVIVVLLLIGLNCEVTIYPWMLYFFQYEGIWQRSIIFCEIWGFIDWGLYVTYTILLAWATIERHILIFHDSWVSTKRKRIFVHYLPITLLLLYGILFYSVTYFFSPCQNISIQANTVCTYPCLALVYVFGMYETIVNNILPVIIIFVFSIALLVRVVWQKYRIRQPIQWRRYRKMAVQLLSVSFLYILFYFPLALWNIFYLCCVSIQIVPEFKAFTYFSSYFVILLFPFVCALSLPELRTKITKVLSLRREARRVGITTLDRRATTNNRLHAQ